MKKTDLEITLGAAFRKLKTRNTGKAVYVFSNPREGVLSGTFGSPWKGVALLKTGVHDLSATSVPLVCMPRFSPLSRCPQSLGRCIEISSLDFQSLQGLPTHSALQSPESYNNHLQQTKAPVSRLPQRAGEVRAGGRDIPHSSGPS